MRRREFITFLGSAVAAWPLPARAQKPSQPVIGYLGLTSPKGEAEMAGSFLKGLKEAGFEEGRNVTVEFLFADGDVGRLPTLAAELVRRNVSIILTGTTAGTVAAKRARQRCPSYS
jgi:putative ABC transport system substrate-binding protein